jgi:cytoskeletal protein RodZ
MDWLLGALVGVGISVILGIWLWQRRYQRRTVEQAERNIDTVTDALETLKAQWSLTSSKPLITNQPASNRKRRRKRSRSSAARRPNT